MCQPEGLLLKGPLTFADLYAETLGIQEHKVAFTKDISKFLPFVEADKVAQHVQRILWRFAVFTRIQKLFVTTGSAMGTDLPS
jgi:hypothetical protein